MLQRYIFMLLLCTMLMVGCMESPYYQKQYSIPQNAWQSQFQPSFKFDVSDTAAMYDLSFLIRHTEAYPYSNIWVLMYIKYPGTDSFQHSRIEIPLAEASGKWMGHGMGELWEQNMPITAHGNSMSFNKKGTYEIKIEQNMRINPLPEVLQVGLRVEKKSRK